MTVSLLIPCGFKSLRRETIFQWVLARWMLQFPDWQVCLGTDDPENYNRSKARNNAFQQADGDIIVLSDADTATMPENVNQALGIVNTTNAWVIAHTMYYSLKKNYTDYLLEQSPDVEPEAHLGPSKHHWVMNGRSEAGVIVMPREAYEAAGGYDERFVGWSYEDNAFASKLRQKWGESSRTTGDVWHLWHERGLDFDGPYVKQNEALYERIRDGQDV